MKQGKPIRATRHVAAGLVLAVAAVPATAAEQTRCGWLGNPTPANWFLDDADGVWTLSVQGGWVADGFYDLPPGDPALVDEWVSSNGEPGRSSYGYGCACVTGTFDAATGHVLSASAMETLRLSRCRADPNLPAE